MAKRWTWKRISEALTAKGYACVVRTMHGRRVYEVYVQELDGGHGASRFDTVEEVRDAYGFHDDEGEG